MRTLALISVALIALPTIALASSTTKGVVKVLDEKTCAITLAENTVYQLGKGCKLSKLKVGEKVAIVWKDIGGLKEVVQLFVAM